MGMHPDQPVIDVQVRHSTFKWLRKFAKRNEMSIHNVVRVLVEEARARDEADAKQEISV